MPEQKTLERARKDKREGKSPSTQAGEFVREEIEHIREGKHGARSTKQAIAIGLSKARESQDVQQALACSLARVEARASPGGIEAGALGTGAWRSGPQTPPGQRMRSEVRDGRRMPGETIRVRMLSNASCSRTCASPSA